MAWDLATSMPSHDLTYISSLMARNYKLTSVSRLQEYNHNLCANW